MIKDIRVEVRFKNNALYKRIMRQATSVAAFCRMYNLNQQDLGLYLNLKKSPVLNPKQKDVDIRWSKVALSLSFIFKCLPEDLFPEHLRLPRKNFYAIEVSAKEAELTFSQGLLGPVTPEDALIKKENGMELIRLISTLPGREQAVIKHRFGINTKRLTLDELAKNFGVTKERVRQLETKGLRRMRKVKGAYQSDQ